MIYFVQCSENRLYKDNTVEIYNRYINRVQTLCIEIYDSNFSFTANIIGLIENNTNIILYSIVEINTDALNKLASLTKIKNIYTNIIIDKFNKDLFIEKSLIELFTTSNTFIPIHIYKDKRVHLYRENEEYIIAIKDSNFDFDEIIN